MTLPKTQLIQGLVQVIQQEEVTGEVPHLFLDVHLPITMAMVEEAVARAASAVEEVKLLRDDARCGWEEMRAPALLSRMWWRHGAFLCRQRFRVHCMRRRCKPWASW